LPLPFWRQPSGALLRLVGLLLLEAALLILVFVLVATVVIPLAAPPVGVPTATPTTTSAGT
jgi:hypothetical protein